MSRIGKLPPMTVTVTVGDYTATVNDVLAPDSGVTQWLRIYRTDGQFLGGVSPYPQVAYELQEVEPFYELATEVLDIVDFVMEQQPNPDKLLTVMAAE